MYITWGERQTQKLQTKRHYFTFCCICQRNTSKVLDENKSTNIQLPQTTIINFSRSSCRNKKNVRKGSCLPCLGRSLTELIDQEKCKAKKEKRKKSLKTKEIILHSALFATSTHRKDLNVNKSTREITVTRRPKLFGFRNFKCISNPQRN